MLHLSSVYGVIVPITEAAWCWGSEMMLSQKRRKNELLTAFKPVNTFLPDTGKLTCRGLTACQDQFFTAVNIHIPATPNAEKFKATTIHTFDHIRRHRKDSGLGRTITCLCLSPICLSPVFYEALPPTRPVQAAVRASRPCLLRYFHKPEIPFIYYTPLREGPNFHHITNYLVRSSKKPSGKLKFREIYPLFPLGISAFLVLKKRKYFYRTCSDKKPQYFTKTKDSIKSIAHHADVDNAGLSVPAKW
jgi:hypothetical protein